MRSKLYPTYIASCIGALWIAGCSYAPETEPIFADEATEISKTAALVSPAFSGPETARIGCSVTYTGMSNPGYTTKWEFGETATDHTFTAMPDKIQVITSNSTTYQIVILAAPGTYTIRRSITDSGGAQWGSYKEVTVPSEGASYIEQYVPYKFAGSEEISYIREGSLVSGSRMEEAYWVRTFSSKPTTANACYNYLIPVYKVKGISQYTYQMNAPTSGSYSIPFYLFGSQRPGTIPIYLFKEYTKAPVSSYPSIRYTGNNYFSTTSKDPGIQLPPSGSPIYTENAGIVGYAFPAVPQ